MVRYSKLMRRKTFLAQTQKQKNNVMVIKPLYYGSKSLYNKPLNEGVNAILHGGEYIVPAKLVHLIPKRLKQLVRDENK